MMAFELAQNVEEPGARARAMEYISVKQAECGDISGTLCNLNYIDNDDDLSGALIDIAKYLSK